MTTRRELVVDVERVAHGGVCVAHAPDGRAVFVRHSLPGERVRIVITEERKTYLRADALEVLEPSPHRVVPPCPWAGPGRCGGCDWQHVALEEQRRMKAAVVAEQLQRLAHLERAVVVEQLPDAPDGLHWRTRMRLAVDGDGRAGLHRYRSHHIERIDDCLLAVGKARIPEVLDREWPVDAEVTVDVSSSGERAVAMGTPDAVITEHAAGRQWSVPVGGFWQVHVAAADVLVDAVIAAVDPRPEDICLDLYSGVGLFAGALAPQTGAVTAVESDGRATAVARRNLADLPVRVMRDRVDRFLPRCEDPFDVVVLDPPRKGAGRGVVEAIAKRKPRVVVYVACDPAALARDVATFAARGYSLTGLRAFDLFPMTAHVECVAQLTATP